MGPKGPVVEITAAVEGASYTPLSAGIWRPMGDMRTNTWAGIAGRAFKTSSADISIHTTPARRRGVSSARRDGNAAPQLLWRVCHQAEHADCDEQPSPSLLNGCGDEPLHWSTLHHSSPELKECGRSNQLPPQKSYTPAQTPRVQVIAPSGATKRVSVKRGDGDGSVGLAFVRRKGRAGPLHISWIVPGGSAEKTGQIKVGDAILEIDGQSVVELDLERAVCLFRGAPGSNLCLLIQCYPQGSAHVCDSELEGLSRSAIHGRECVRGSGENVLQDLRFASWRLTPITPEFSDACVGKSSSPDRHEQTLDQSAKTSTNANHLVDLSMNASSQDGASYWHTEESMASSPAESPNPAKPKTTAGMAYMTDPLRALSEQSIASQEHSGSLPSKSSDSTSSEEDSESHRFRAVSATASSCVADAGFRDERYQEDEVGPGEVRHALAFAYQWDRCHAEAQAPNENRSQSDMGNVWDTARKHAALSDTEMDVTKCSCFGTHFLIVKSPALR